MDEKARPARADPPKLLEYDDIEQVVQAEAAIFFRHGAAEEAPRTGLQPELSGNNALLLPSGVVRDDLFLDEAADRGPPDLVLFGEQGAFDHRSVPDWTPAARCALSRCVERSMASRAVRH